MKTLLQEFLEIMKLNTPEFRGNPENMMFSE